MKTKIFISHRVSDSKIALILQDFLVLIGIKQETIFCSSLPGNDVKENISKEVYKALCQSKIDIMLLSKEYYQSVYCQNEMGIIWFKKNNTVIPFALPEIKPKVKLFC